MKRFSCLLAVLFILAALTVPCFADSGSGGSVFLEYLGIGIFAGILVAGIVAGCIIYTYKKKTKSAIYPLGRYANLDLKMRDDRFMGSFVTKRRLQNDPPNNKR